MIENELFSSLFMIVFNHVGFIVTFYFYCRTDSGSDFTGMSSLLKNRPGILIIPV